MVTSISCPSRRFCMQTWVGSSQGFFFYLFWIIFFLFNFIIQHFICYKLSFDFFFSFYFLWDYHDLLSNKILQHLIFLKLFFLFYHPIFNWLGIGLQAFFFHFYFYGVISILYMWSHGLQVNSVWLVSIFFYFLSFFFGFYPSTLGCLVTKLHNFI